MSMFDKTQYVIEGGLAATFLKIAKDNYSIKDVNGSLLAYFKRRSSGFGFEGTDGTSLGEIRTSGNRFEVYDAHNWLQATIRREERRVSEKNGFRREIIHFLPVAVGVAMLMVSLLMMSLLPKPLPGPFGLFFLVSFFGGIILGVSGVFYMIYMLYRSTVKLGRPEWLIEDAEGQQLAKAIGDFSISGKASQILALDGSVLAQIHKKRGLAAFRNSYRIDISRQGFNPLLILSYAVIIARRYREAIGDATW